MKKLISLFLILLLIFAIPCVAYAQQDFSAMTDDELRALIEAASAELDSRGQVEESQQEIIEYKKSLCGEWVELYGRWEKDPEGTYSGWIWKPQGEYSFTLLENGSLEIDGSVGSWQLAEDDNQLIVDTGVKTIWSIFDDDGIIKLQTNNAEKTLVKVACYAELADKMFLTVSVDESNITEYIKALNAIDWYNEWGEKAGYRIRFRNNIYEDGYVYIGHSNDYMNEYSARTEYGNEWDSIKWPFGGSVYEGVNSFEFVCFGRAKGTITFASADYLARNYIDEDGHRTIEFIDGAKIVFEMGKWNPEEYEDDMY